MTDKQKQAFAGPLAGMAAILVVIYQNEIRALFPFFENIIFLIGLTLFVALLVYGIIFSLLPNKKNKKKQAAAKKSATTNNKKKTNTTKKQGGSRSVSNSLRSDSEILKLPIEVIGWKEFERLCYLYYKAKGYKPELTKEGADGGVDLIVYDPKHKAKVAIQIKHWIDSGRQVSVKEIRELDSAKKNHKCVLADFISSTGYTTAAMLEADRTKIKCYSADRIVAWKEKQLKKSV
ncbi:restriction endonuclease [Cytobacillus gottheilii]|uniref:restriction endonuclease n=1 Tax=Cytobacillus gottheilii TaxID=859144 RepID=UPI000832F345|nr:restriction endonuclease [Cytobacillus gottheilii]